MRTQSNRPIPHFVSLAAFCKELGVYHTLAKLLIELGILVPSGYLGGGTPIFLADLATLEQARIAVSQFRCRQNRSRQNLRELNYV